MREMNLLGVEKRLDIIETWIFGWHEVHAYEEERWYVRYKPDGTEWFRRKMIFYHKDEDPEETYSIKLENWPPEQEELEKL